MADIFVSYASEDRDRIKPLIDAITAEGISVWWDRRIGMGSDFEREIERELDAARCVVVVWSEKSVDSDWVRNEAQEGYDRGILVPARIDDVKPPLAFRRAQTADLVEWPGSVAEFEPFLDAIRSGLGESFVRPERSEITQPIADAIAVLPFVNMSNDPDQEFFSDGISEDILNELAKGAELTVRPRSSSFSLKGESLDIQSIGKRLNVTHVLEGSVRRSGERIRVTAQLSEVITNRSVWSERYDRDLTDIFEVQDEITGEILRALNAHLTQPRAPRRFAGTEAYNAFQRGRHHLGQWEFTLALEWFEKATGLDPLNADAWAGRARILDMQGPRRGQSLEDHREEIAAHFDRVLAIDPAHPQALASRAENTFFRDRDYQSSINQLVALVKANPNHEEAHRSLSWVLRAIGRAELYLQATRRMVEIAPLCREAMLQEVDSLLTVGQIDAARRAFDEFSRLQNREDPTFVSWLAILDRDTDALQAIIDRNLGGWTSFRREWTAAMVPYLDGDFSRAREIIAPRKRSDHDQSILEKHMIALIERDFDAALDHYADGLDSGIWFAFVRAHLNYPYRRTFPEFYEGPRFEHLLREFGFDATSTAEIEIPGLAF